MKTTSQDHGRLLQVEVAPELRRQLEAAAARRGLSVRDYVGGALQRDLARADQEAPDGEWTRLSVPVFARDWESDADAIYDDLA